MNERRINLGCGLHAPPTWENLDSSPRVWIDKIPFLPIFGFERRFAAYVKRWDAYDPLPFADRSARFIYSSHMIEHLPRIVALGLLRECLRVLEPGGRIRLMTPNLRQIVEDYLNRRKEERLRATAGDHLMVSLGTFPEKVEQGFADRFLNYWRSKNLHHWLYDAESLGALLTEAGFKEILSGPATKTEFPDLELLEPAQFRAGSVAAEASR